MLPFPLDFSKLLQQEPRRSLFTCCTWCWSHLWELTMKVWFVIRQNISTIEMLFREINTPLLVTLTRKLIIFVKGTEEDANFSERIERREGGVAERWINSSKWLFNEPKGLTQIPRITRRDPVDDAVSRQRFWKRTVTPWLTRPLDVPRTPGRSREAFFFFSFLFFFFSTGARTGTVCGGKRFFSHVNIAENRTML